MAKLIPKKLDLLTINNGNEYTEDDIIKEDEFSKFFEGVAWSQNQTEILEDKFDGLIAPSMNILKNAEIMPGTFWVGDRHEKIPEYTTFKILDVKAGIYKGNTQFRGITGSNNDNKVATVINSVNFELLQDASVIYICYMNSRLKDNSLLVWNKPTFDYINEGYKNYNINKLGDDIKLSNSILKKFNDLMFNIKNLLNYGIYRDKHYVSASPSSIEDIASADNYEVWSNIHLPPGQYKVVGKIRFITKNVNNLDVNPGILEYMLTSTSIDDVFAFTFYKATKTSPKVFNAEYNSIDVEEYNQYILNSKIKVKMEGEEGTISEVKDILTGKKYCACGDSFTHGGYAGNEGIPSDYYTYTSGPYAGHQKTYPYILGLRTGMEVTNLALGGQTMANDGSGNCFSNGIYKQIPIDADYITIKLGINDLNYHSPVGTINDTTADTFYGAWNIVLKYILENHPFAKLGIIITSGCGWVYDYTDATREVAKKWGVPVLDEVNDVTKPLLHRTGRPGISTELYNLKMSQFSVSDTNRHPNIDAQKYEATMVENFLRTL